MKKVLFPILALVLAVALVIPMVLVSAHTEESPYVADLLAGQTEDVGDVKVWNDGNNLYVTYNITELDWVITETHLYAGKNVPPTTAPGQFPYDDDDATLVTDTVVTYEIPLDDIDGYSMQLNRKGKSTGVMVADGAPGVEPCNDVYIAAHAVVEKCVVEPRTLYPELTWQRSSETSVAVYPGYGAQWTEAQGLAIALDPATLVWDGGTGSQYFTGYSTRSDISWASWNCTQLGEPSTTGTDLRRFQATFDIPVGYSVTGGTLGSVNPGYETVIPMNDNIYIFVNMDADGSPGDELIFWGGTISIPQLDPTRIHFLGMLRRDTQPSNQPVFPETDGWHMDGAIPAISSSLFVEGANVLDVFAEELWTGGGMHELGLTLEGEQTTCETETAWADGLDFTHKNWATYFMYHVQQGELETHGAGTAQWSDDGDPCSGEYWWKLYVPDGTADMAAVAFDCDIALEDITTLTFYKKVTSYGASGWNPSVILLIDADGDGLEFGISEAMEWHFTHSGTLLGDDAFVECESPTGLSAFDTICIQLDAFAMSAWGADASGFLYGTGGYPAGLAGFQSGGPYGAIDPTDKVLMVAIVIGGAGSWMNETADIDDVVIAGP